MEILLVGNNVRTLVQWIEQSQTLPLKDIQGVLRLYYKTNVQGYICAMHYIYLLILKDFLSVHVIFVSVDCSNLSLFVY